MIRMFKKT